MATPARTLWFKTVRNAAIGAWGPQYEDITRAGASTTRFKYVGKRGSQTTVTGIRFFDTEGNARAFISAVEGAKGAEAFLVSDLDNDYRWRVFVVDVACEPPKRIESTLSNANWQVTCQLTVMRTG